MKEDLNTVKMKAENSAQAREHYHHGDLKEALIEATEAILLEKGIAGLTLRAVARRVGVSPSAPAHHFGDAAGLLSEVAARGFEEFRRTLQEADARGGADPAARLRELGTAYVAFALKHPARVRLMFQRDMCNPDNERLKAAADGAFAVLEDGVRAFCSIPPGEPLEPDAQGVLLAAWSMVHGFAVLALDGAFDDAAEAMGGGDAIVERMLPAMLATLTGKPKRNADRAPLRYRTH